MVSSDKKTRGEAKVGEILRNSLDLKTISKLARDQSPPVIESSYNFTTKNDEKSISTIKEDDREAGVRMNVKKLDLRSPHSGTGSGTKPSELDPSAKPSKPLLMRPNKKKKSAYAS